MLSEVCSHRSMSSGATMRISGGGGVGDASVVSRAAENNLKMSGAALAFGPLAFGAPSVAHSVGAGSWSSTGGGQCEQGGMPASSWPAFPESCVACVEAA